MQWNPANTNLRQKSSRCMSSKFEEDSIKKVEMEKIAFEEILITCRICLTTSTTDSGFIHMDTFMLESLTFVDCFNFCTNLGATTSDNLPAHICLGCSNILEVSYDFLKKSQHADDILRANLLGDFQNGEEQWISIDDDVEEGKEQIIVIPEASIENNTKTYYEFHVDKEDVQVMHQNHTEKSEKDASEAETKDSKRTPRGFKWTCKICLKDQISRKHYEAHVNKHLGISPYKCTLCTYECRYKQSIKRHYKGIHQIEPSAKLLEASAEFIDIYTEDDSNIPEEPETPCTDESYLMSDDNSQDCKQLELDNQKENLETKSSVTPKQTTKMDRHLEITQYSCRICCFFCRFKCSIVRHYKGKHKIHPTPDMIEPDIEYDSGKDRVDADLNLRLSKDTDNNLRLSKDTNDSLKNVDDPDEHSKDDLLSNDTITNNPKKKITGYKCPKCTFIARSIPLVEKHLSETHYSDENSGGSIIYDCKECESEFKTKSSLEEHIKNMHPEGKQYNAMATCDICGKECRSMALATHKRNHRSQLKRSKNREKLFLCSSCPKKYPSSRTLEFHEKYCHSVNAAKVFTCDQCPSKFICEYYLTKHMRTVHIQRKLKCDLCGHLFKLKSQLRDHMKRHSERIYQCKECDKSFVKQFELKLHMRSHTGERPFQCSMCEKSFVLGAHLKTHIAVSHSNESIKCRFCKKEFKGGKSRRYYRHIYQHTGMPYKCEICSSGHERKESMRRHMKSVHQSNISNDELVRMYYKNTGRFAKHRLLLNIGEKIIQSQNQDNLEEEQIDGLLYDIEETYSDVNADT